MLLIGLFYIFFPGLLIAVLLLKRPPNVLMWVLSVALTGLSVAFIWVIARWEVVGIYLRPVFPVLFMAASVLSYRRIRKPDTPASKITTGLNIGLHLLMILFMGVFSWLALRGYKVPDHTIELASPLRDGQYIVLHGGSRPMVNAHFHVNPQNYAIDVVGLNRFGMRATSIGGGSQLEDYVIFNQPVYSPVNGKVLLAVDEFEDLPPPHKDIKHLAGNHILIGSNGNEILLAHLKKGSITVKAGDPVNTQTIIGRVGNTGNTSEPHLHMHVEHGGKPDTILNGTAVPFKIDGRFLLRGDRIN